LLLVGTILDVLKPKSPKFLTQGVDVPLFFSLNSREGKREIACMLSKNFQTNHQLDVDL